ncbi:MAG: NADH:ubiquinone reductase (Na(+)-transporting) subunit B [Melioribacteraceae bacterium]|nr:NADH:ubiquinone reductase (Na(+)-transporting) subunit B [Melioribacteraceae bacterium]MCF8355287.1 NADH:ubiquinone reductase (Na(+)-transporting) subunit B [Melioribacteraceae bacterium]MCF8394133.1 NADH:ubiquinone reductase (Na(+)-transporting) subunit B [Melioribacteraceae bacterium]MCF8418128.1 NADH:ubiquinone reductase (Na(+)-transporting) subunit B [Melioribacteraceae bacterium]
MKFLRNFLDKQEKHFLKGGKLETFYPLYETADTFLYTSAAPTKSASHIRDVMDLKRMMMMVVIALVPAVFMAFYNTGLQANLGLQELGAASSPHWQAQVIEWLGLGFDPTNILGNIIFGALYFLPIYIVTLAVGGFWEVLFAVVRKHEVNEGFLVTSLLFPLILPPNIPYWQVALGISFGVVIGKEVFGGVGMNILNPALTARAFLFFAYPAEISGDKVWVAVDGLSSATPLAQFADSAMSVSYSWMDSFIGLIPGSMGETSALACLIGAAILIFSKVGSWKIMVSVIVGTILTTLALNAVGSDTNPMFGLPFYWHFVIGGFAFGTVFMATDPVSAAMTENGKYVYGFLIGFFVVLVRVVNPAFPEGMMLAILFMNVFAPIIDRYFINKNIKRRLARNVI